MQEWLPTLPEHIELAGVPWHITAVSLQEDDHPWAGQSDYFTLINQHLTRSELPRKWSLTFDTPTTFHTGSDIHLPFTLPDALLASWLRRWQAYSPFPSQWELRPHWRQALYVSAYRLKTVPVRHGRRLTIGCVGQFTLTTGKLSADERAMIAILAAYAFYCGSGYKTTQGMGLTRIN